jgi:hypothetical protein
MIRRSHRARIAVVPAVALAAAAMLAPAAAFAAGPTGGFSVRPAHVDVADPASRAYFKPVIAPGAAFVDQAIVGNSGDAPVELRVSAVDGLTGSTSGAVYANREEPVTRAGGWVVPDVSLVRVAPHTEKTVGFGVRVPGDATPGDHLAGLAFEDAHPRSSGERFSVKQVIRTVVGVLIQVPGPAHFGAHVDGVDLVPLPGAGTSAVMIRLGNDGLGLGRPLVSVSLDGPAGYRRSVDRQLDTVLPGDTIPFPLPWPDPLQAGDYDVLVKVTGGLAPVEFRGRVRLGAALQARRAPERAAAHSKGTHMSWLLLLGAGIGGVVLGAIVVRRPRRQVGIDGSTLESLPRAPHAVKHRPALFRRRSREPTA